MPYSVKSVIIIVVVAVVAFVVADLVIPERNAVTVKDKVAVEQPRAQAGDSSRPNEDIPVVVVAPPPAQTGEAAAPKAAQTVAAAVPQPVQTGETAALATTPFVARPASRRIFATGFPLAAAPVDTNASKAAGASIAKTAPIDTKTSKTADAPLTKAPPADTKMSKTADAPIAKAAPVVDTKTTKAIDTKTTAAPPQKALAPAPAVQPAAAAQAPPPAQKKPGSSYRIEKATLCSAIQNREPQGITNKFSKDAPQVYYYTHLVGARDSTTVIHRWYQNGKLVQTSILPVKSQYWRTHSRRNLLTHNGDVAGQWRVDVVEPGSNAVLESASFTIE